MKILVIGVRNEHLLKLRKTYANAKIVGITDSKIAKQKVANSESYDLIISMTKFTSHRTEKNYGRLNNYYRVNGGVSSLMLLLNSKLV